MKLMRTSFLLAALSLAVSAQEVQFGAHGGFGIPVGDLNKQADGRFGLVLGGHMGLYYGGGHEVRPRIEYMNFDGGSLTGGVSAFTLGADYLYYLSTRPQDFFISMGLNVQRWHVSASNNVPSENKTSVGLALGAGHRFNRTFSVEGKYLTGQFRSNNGQAGVLQILGAIRF